MRFARAQHSAKLAFAQSQISSNLAQLIHWRSLIFF
ncbi:hypothetical protein THICB1_30378 [Thiomonas arsenitoxydans]|uniref:Uncharacterized protein n=1 Tax=Thiomonas arsenitoxydans (strain DSM 22701 / CIP 110005 / 3As) TaxID=426114 RepID=A0ABM9T614_THIA3|nr:hypothetical protein ACO7_300046 [Thiomonas arsenitoxydans]CQR32701.1 hypothetical protein ACO3_320046 [Thiomonas arsenitoxydans]CQR34281.1 hypothetical protein THICB1_30378 [Thiomonas arsenitoxydans]CQR40554.1 hypothetical protein THICB6_80381 [Thiomonas arsenitoxydans]